MATESNPLIGSPVESPVGSPIELPVELQNVRLWIVADPKHDSDDQTTTKPNRWLVASRRFAPAMSPDPISLSFVVSGVPSVRSHLRGHAHAAVLWDADGIEHRGDVFDAVAVVAAVRPDVLQFVAAGSLSHDERLALGEMGVAAIVDQPEHLPRWTPLVTRYWSRSSVGFA